MDEINNVVRPNMFTALKKYAQFSGRASRREFWLFQLFQWVLFTLLHGVFWSGLITYNIYQQYSDDGNIVVLVPIIILFLIFILLLHLALFVPNIAVLVRRLQDLKLSGLFALLLLAPGGTIIMAIWAMQDSQPGSNVYGPNPKGIDEAVATWRFRPALGIVLAVVFWLFFTIVPIFLGMLLPALSQAREKARRVGCMHNLKQIGLAIDMYKLDYDNNYPNLSDEYGLNQLDMARDMGLFTCPSGKSNYRYIGNGLKADAGDYLPVAFDSLDAHKKYFNVLYGDGHVEGHNISWIASYEELFRKVADYDESKKEAYELLINNAIKLDLAQ